VEGRLTKWKVFLKYRRGSLVFANNDKFIGEWKNGKRNGYGK